ncbi:MAG: exosome complex RNA-binding protein Rrp4, partial [Candidatus Hydrothermarchaeota archaeon]|nr:exosome complex RNA-binding protein Rrp4 [Candidatus Hydrothermarchaeota archaeon]
EKKDYIRVIPLTGKYMPKVEDFVIGKIADVQFSHWEVDINSAYSAILNASDYFRDIDIFQTALAKILAPGDLIFAVVREITPTKKVYITMADRGARILKGGRLLKISPTKVPRVIGKNSSMISMIKKEAKCDILVGQNGRIWLNGEADRICLAVKAIELIEREAHTAGLTERVRDMFT